MTSKAAVLERFNEPLVMREFPVSPLAGQEVLVRILAAGVCGSDVHMWRGKDPRTPLPLILGHEGVGEVAEIGGKKEDVLGRRLKVGDVVMWERGIMCGRCYYCVIKKQPALCTQRKTYGISVSCKEPPHLQGCYAESIHLLAGAHAIRLDGEVDAATLVAASCSGATAAHTVELCDIKQGDTVVVQGPGPLGLFVVAFAVDRGAEVHVFGVAADRKRLQFCREFGAAGTVVVEETTEDERREYVLQATQGRGANVVIDCTGVAGAMREGLGMAAPYGVYALPGIATPVGEVPLRLYEEVARKNVRIQGVWVSDTSHLYQAIRLVRGGRFPFERLVTHRFSLETATAALETMERREAIKAVLIP